MYSIGHGLNLHLRSQTLQYTVLNLGHSLELSHLATVANSVCTSAWKLLPPALNKAESGTAVNQGHSSLYMSHRPVNFKFYMGSLVPASGAHLSLSPIQSGKGLLTEHPWAPCNLLAELPLSLAVATAQTG